MLTVSAPAENEAGERPEILRPWLLLGGTLVIGFAGIALLFGQPPGVGYAVAAWLAAVIWVALGFALGHPSQRSGAGLDRAGLVLQHDGGRPGLAGFAGIERAHGHRAGAPDGGDLSPRPPGADEPDRLCHWARYERAGAGLSAVPAGLRRSAQGATDTRQAAPASAGLVGGGAGGAVAAGLRCAVRRRRRSFRRLLAGHVRLAPGLSPTDRAPDLEPDPELAGAGVGAACFHSQDAKTGVGRLR